jgi:uncharacterized protein YebE (UPF0316 family)
MFLSTLLWSLLIFFARAADVGLGTTRVQLIVRRRKFLAAMIGFIEVLIYILIVSRVIRDISDWQGWLSIFPVVAYAAGFAVGTILGITLSEKAGRGIVELTIITHGPPETVEAAVREAGYALTRYWGIGREGPVEMFSAICGARQVPRLIQLVTCADPKAFLYTHELSGLRGGHVYGLKNKL